MLYLTSLIQVHIQHLPTSSPSVEWIVDLREKLTEFITQNIQITVLPQLVQLLQGHEDLKKKETQLLKKHQILQADYHNLLSIASELVGTLASSLNGQQINPEYVARILERLQIFKKGTDSTSKNGPSYLKFDQIKSILSLNEPGNEPKSIVLLHALRMRIIQQPTPQEKRQVVKTYIEYDLLQLASKKHLLTLLLHSNPILCEQFAKLLNIMTCFSCGRTYLACGEAFLIENLAQLIQTSTDTMTPLLLHSLGILEKMSLRRFVQSHLISLNIVQDCVKLLGHIEALSDVGLTYVCGLLMNLVSRNEGRKRAEEVGDAMLAAVCELLENDDPMVRAYAHGICLSLLDDFFFKDKANAIGLHELLRYLKENAPSPIAKQIEFVLEKLEHEPLDPKDWDTVSEDGEDGDFEEEIEEEDLHEELDPIQELSLGPEEIYGDSFLCEFEASDCRSQGKGGFNPGIQTLSHTQTRISNTFSISNLSHRPSSSLKQILPPVHSHSVSDFASVTPKTLLPTSTTPLSTLNPLQNQGYPTLTSSEKSYKSPKTRLQMLENELLEYEDVFKPRPRLTQTPITQLAM
ncbi:LisH domain-containing protein armc9 [Coelomomyces lativittatus]|nr:LisH domain-containing protein armc9 [Coelomomyces lativittatus]